MHGSKTYLWYTDKRTVGANFNPAPNGTRIPGKKIENNNIFLMEPLASREILSRDNGFYRFATGRSPSKDMYECETAARID